MQDVLEDNLHEETQIFVCDINPNMLNVGKKRALERGKVNGVSKLPLDELCVLLRGLHVKFMS
jgi:ubiquinone/menaquinone biosynthesis C-methylase UbiE